MLKKISRDRNDYDHWKTTIEILQDENTILKNKLSNLIHDCISGSANLEVAELFQTRFLKMDEELQAFNFKLKDLILKQKKMNIEHSGMRLQTMRRNIVLKMKLEDLKSVFVHLITDFEQFHHTFNPD